jgi:hypothetical protein
MRERVRYDMSLTLPLKAVIANSCGRLQCCFHIAGLDKIPFRLSVIGPHSSETIGLEFDSDL